MMAPNDLPALSREELLAVVVERQRQIAAGRASHEALRAELDQLTGGGKRQAAPFSQDTPVAEPKPPGRKPGSGPFGDRESPPPETSTAPPVDGRVGLAACPGCGGPRADVGVACA